jgi:hypothetical protein
VSLEQPVHAGKTEEVGRDSRPAGKGGARQDEAAGVKALRLVELEFARQDGERNLVRANIDQRRAASLSFAAYQFDQFGEQAHAAVIRIGEEVAKFVGWDNTAGQPEALGSGCNHAHNRVASGGDTYDGIAQRIAEILPVVKVLDRAARESFSKGFAAERDQEGRDLGQIGCLCQP